MIFLDLKKIRKILKPKMIAQILEEENLTKMAVQFQLEKKKN